MARAVLGCGDGGDRPPGGHERSVPVPFAARALRSSCTRERIGRATDSNPNSFNTMWRSGLRSTAVLLWAAHRGHAPAGNAVSHPVHQERFGKLGKTLLGSDSHTPAAGAIGMLAIGAGGLDVAQGHGSPSALHHDARHLRGRARRPAP